MEALFDVSHLTIGFEENGKINKNEYELAITKKNELIDSLINDNNKYIKIDFFKYL